MRSWELDEDEESTDWTVTGTVTLVWFTIIWFGFVDVWDCAGRTTVVGRGTVWLTTCEEMRGEFKFWLPFMTWLSIGGGIIELEVELKPTSSTLVGRRDIKGFWTKVVFGEGLRGCLRVLNLFEFSCLIASLRSALLLQIVLDLPIFETGLGAGEVGIMNVCFVLSLELLIVEQLASSFCIKFVSWVVNESLSIVSLMTEESKWEVELLDWTPIIGSEHETDKDERGWEVVVEEQEEGGGGVPDLNRLFFLEFVLLTFGEYMRLFSFLPLCNLRRFKRVILATVINLSKTELASCSFLEDSENTIESLVSFLSSIQSYSKTIFSGHFNIKYNSPIKRSVSIDQPFLRVAISTSWQILVWTSSLFEVAASGSEVSVGLHSLSSLIEALSHSPIVAFAGGNGRLSLLSFSKRDSWLDSVFSKYISLFSLKADSTSSFASGWASFSLAKSSMSFNIDKERTVSAIGGKFDLLSSISIGLSVFCAFVSGSFSFNSLHDSLDFALWKGDVNKLEVFLRFSSICSRLL